MAWEWVAPTATAIVGVAGMWFTYRTSKRARETQAESEERAREEARRRDLTALRQQVYSEFLGAAHEFGLMLAGQDGMDRSSVEDATIRQQAMLLPWNERFERVHELAAMEIRVRLISDVEVAKAIDVILPIMLEALRPASQRTPEQQAEVDGLPAAMKRLNDAMRAEIRA